MTSLPLFLRVTLLAILFLFTGWSLSRPAGRGEGIAPVSRAFYLILSGILALSFSAFVLALAGYFSLAAVFLLLSVSGLAAYLASDRTRCEVSRSPVGLRSIIPLLLVIILAGGFFLKPHGYIFGGWDPGIYVNTGGSIARNGGISYRDDFFAGLGKDRKIFSSRFRNRFDGFDSKKARTGLTMPHFYHLFPSVMAVFFAVAGPHGPLWVAPFFALAAILAFYVLLSSLVSPRAAFFGAALLALNINQIWFSRFPAPESAAQFFILAGLFCLMDLLQKPSGIKALMGALCFEAAVLAKIDILPLIFIILLAVALRLWMSGDVPESSFGFLLLAVHGLFEPYRLFSAGAYTGRILEDFGLPAPLISYLFLVVAFLMILPWIIRRYHDRPPLNVPAPASSRWRWGLVGLILLISFWGYFMRPYLSPTSDAGNLLSLGWVLTPPGFLAAVLGVCLVVLKFQDTKGIYLLLTILPMSLLSFLSWKLTPIHFWATKRYQVVTIWCCILFVVYLYDKVLDKGIAGRLLFAGLFLVMIFIPLKKALPWIGQSDYREYPAFIDSLAGNFSTPDVILCRTDRTAAPLHFLYGLESLVFRPGREADWDRASSRSRRWLKEGRRVFFLGGEGVRKPPPPSWRMVEEVTLETSHMQRRKGGLPQRRVEVNLTLPLYRFEPVRPSSPSEGVDP